MYLTHSVITKVLINVNYIFWNIYTSLTDICDQVNISCITVYYMSRETENVHKLHKLR